MFFGEAKLEQSISSALDNMLKSLESFHHRPHLYLLVEDVAFFVPTTNKALKRRLREAVKAKQSPNPPDSDDESDVEDAFDLWWLRDDSD